MNEASPPIVTFGLIAYRQEKYIREAIEGAFAQRCSAMEIILSDDCSPDGTFDIMAEMAASYRGPHTVRVRREPINVGTVQHLINIARAAHGELLVVAAGDDVSYPDRARKLYDAWKESGAAALASHHDEIDAEGRMLSKSVSFAPSTVTQWLFGNERQAHRINGIIQTVPGFCAAYPRAFWADLPDPPRRLLVEDGLAGALIIFRGERIHRVAQSLVAYRLLDDSLSNRRGGVTVDEIRLREAKINRHAHDSLASIDFLIDLARRENLVIHPKTIAALAKGRAQNALIADYWNNGAFARIARLANIRSVVDAKFHLPRLFGMRVFAALRIRLEKRQTRRLTSELKTLPQSARARQTLAQ